MVSTLLLQQNPREIVFWRLFICACLISLFLASISPVTFGISMPLLGIIPFIIYRLIFQKWARLSPVYAKILTALIALSFVSCFWAVEPMQSLERTFKISGLFIGGLGFLGVINQCPKEVWERQSRYLPVLVLLIGTIASIESFFDFPLMKFFSEGEGNFKNSLLNKNMSVFMMLLPLAFLISYRNNFKPLIALTIITGSILFYLTSSQASQLAFTSLPILFFAITKFDKYLLKFLLSALAFLIILMPWLAPPIFSEIAQAPEQGSFLEKASAVMRLENWDFISRKVQESPWLGFGIDATRHIKFDSKKLFYPDDHIMHPHSLALQLWIEFGLVGALFGVMVCFLIYQSFNRQPKDIRRFYLISFSILMVFLLLSWSMWASWLIGFTFILSGFTMLTAKTFYNAQIRHSDRES